MNKTKLGKIEFGGTYLIQLFIAFSTGDLITPNSKLDGQQQQKIKIFFLRSQVDDSGHRIPRHPVWKMQESHWILHEDTGNRWNMEAVVRPQIVRIYSGGFLSTSCAFRQEPAGKNSKIFRPEYCFDKITGTTRNRQCPDRVVRPGLKKKRKIFFIMIKRKDFLF